MTAPFHQFGLSDGVADVEAGGGVPQPANRSVEKNAPARNEVWMRAFIMILAATSIRAARSNTRVAPGASGSGGAAGKIAGVATCDEFSTSHAISELLRTSIRDPDQRCRRHQDTRQHQKAGNEAVGEI